jgi:cytochrome c556
MTVRPIVLIAIGVMCVCCRSSTLVRANEPGEKRDEVPLMERKLTHAQNILSAIAREDYAKLSENAEGLRKLAEKQWIEKETPEYRAQLKDFWVVLEGIRASADDKDIDGATLAYMQMTLSCVRCHKYLRRNPD